MTISKQKKWFCILNLAVGLISGQLCAANQAKSKNMLAVLLFGTKNMKIKRMPRNGELPRIMQVLDLKPRSPVFWRSKSCKTISLTGVYFVLFNESATKRYIDRRHPSTSPLESFFDCDQLGETLRTAPTLLPYWTCIKTKGVKVNGVGHLCLIKKPWLMIFRVKSCGYDVRLGCMWCLNESKTIRNVSGRFFINNRSYLFIFMP